MGNIIKWCRYIITTDLLRRDLYVGGTMVINERKINFNICANVI